MRVDLLFTLICLKNILNLFIKFFDKLSYYLILGLKNENG